jgi:DNA-binding transcriptional MocR family regulator
MTTTPTAGAELAYEQVRAAIVENRYPPGQRLVEQRLAEELGLSRTPVREALHMLEAEGLVVSERSTMDGLTIAQGEKRGGGAFFIVGIARGQQEAMVRPAPDEVMKGGDMVMVVARPGSNAGVAWR